MREHNNKRSRTSGGRRPFAGGQGKVARGRDRKAHEPPKWGVLGGANKKRAEVSAMLGRSSRAAPAPRAPGRPAGSDLRACPGPWQRWLPRAPPGPGGGVGGGGGGAAARLEGGGVPAGASLAPPVLQGSHLASFCSLTKAAAAVSIFMRPL